MNIEFPATDLVILAGGQARRMNGMNKLLQQFDEQIQANKLSLRDCFKQLHAQSSVFQKQSLFCHSINSLDELQQYQQMKAFRQMFI